MTAQKNTQNAAVPTHTFQPLMELQPLQQTLSGSTDHIVEAEQSNQLCIEQ